MNIYVQFPGGPKVRELHSVDEKGTDSHVRVDVDDDGRMVGMQVSGAASIAIDGVLVAGLPPVREGGSG